MVNCLEIDNKLKQRIWERVLHHARQYPHFRENVKIRATQLQDEYMPIRIWKAFETKIFPRYNLDKLIVEMDGTLACAVKKICAKEMDLIKNCQLTTLNIIEDIQVHLHPEINEDLRIVMLFGVVYEEIAIPYNVIGKLGL